MQILQQIKHLKGNFSYYSYRYAAMEQWNPKQVILVANQAFV